MTPQARYWSSDSFKTWCSRQESRVRLVAERAGQRYADRIAKLPQPGGEFDIESRGHTHGGGPSRYGDVDA